MNRFSDFATHTLNTLLSSLDEAISIVNTEGEMVYWNEAAEKTFHIKKEEILGKNVRAFFREEDIMNLKVLKSLTPVRDVYHLPRPDKHVLVSTTPIFDEQNRLIGSMSVEKDITATIILNEKLSTTTNELQRLKQKMKQKEFDDPFYKVKGNSKSLERIILLTKKVAKSDATVLIVGESGVGKELFAQAVHEESLRREKPFIPVNCGAIPQALFESELFGYEAGAYTGASKAGKPGKMELADGGTLFLDEVGELPLEMQVKLLRALQEKEIYRIGGQKPKKVNIRIVAATNRILEDMVANGTFRSDLFYRLNVFSIQIPPLKERVRDIPELVDDHFKELSLRYNRPAPAISQDALNLLCSYHWPGNIRELHNLLERLFVINDRSDISTADVADALPQISSLNKPIDSTPLSLIDEREQLEKERIIQVLRNTYGNKSITAKELGISRATLYKKIKRFGIQL
ncbi:sigma 54-interacting transcriptional regulator [Bacillus sp. FJAT-29790]|uniref:sigma-54 interaction domain-containing protein n=1 Tax=Bacillus sp. FJAT-29790 TaxID=1895002 RepID=UPI001C23380A|nr:sigma 54-interacting transcriptional regulator [Bacillus sp. FJAT-29790]MBU8880655.1 sigma 54-interacting transcriptional regulator [Bacillus sp. FJAT-29790]